MSIKKAEKLRPIEGTTVGYLIRITDEAIILCTDAFKRGDEVSAPRSSP
jgi:hypothetical protein